MDNVTTEYVNGNKDQETNRSHRWWLQDEPHLHIFANIKAIESNQAYRKTSNLRFFRLYANKEILGFASGIYSRTSATDTVTNRVTLNVVRSCTDSIVAKIAKNRPRPIFLTEGEFSLKQRAKKLTKYIDGAFDQANAYQYGQQAFTDSCVFGTGALKVYYEDGQVKVDRVFIDELVIDDAEAMYGKPRSMHQKRYINRDVLLDMYGDDETIRHKIMSATGNFPGENTQGKSTADLVVVVESWHLPSGPDAKDGKHLITIDNCTLSDQPYECDYFPFVFLRWSEPLLGFFGTGLAEELVGIQIEINKILRNIQRAQHLVAVPRVYLNNQSKVISQHIQNAIGSIVKYAGQPPIFQTAQAMTPEIYNHLERLYQKAYEITGVSQLSATSKKPSGLNSGVALREYNDIETERFLIVAQRYEKFFLDLADLFIKVTQRAFEDDKSIQVKAKGKKFVDTIKWKDINLTEDKYAMKAYPTSLLPTTPAGRLEKVQELIQAGLIDKPQAMALLDFPDIESFSRRQTASIDAIELCITKILEDGEYFSPEPEMDLQLAIKIATAEYLRGKVENVPEERLLLLLRFKAEAQQLIELQQPVVEPELPQGVQ